jgi:histidinol-phosphate aminotransferase
MTMQAPKRNHYLDMTAPGIPALNPYIPGKPVSELERELGLSDTIKLASNENPLGPPESAKRAILDQLGELARYPDGSGFALRNKLAALHGVNAESITLGNGSNDILDLVARTFLHPGVEAVYSQYGFAIYAIATQAVGATARIAAARDYGHDLQAIRALVGDNTRVVFIANPNNPTGTWLAAEELKGFLESLPDQVITVVDEAYIEYVQEPDYPDASRWLDEFPNLIVTRTFSKAYGLAGLRIGYGLSHPGVAELMNRVRHPFNANSLALAAAEAALDDQAHIHSSVEMNIRGMEQLTAGFAALGLSFIPSVGNFVTVDLGRSAAEVDQGLLREGCIARPVANYGLPNHLRVTVGLPEENSRFLEALERVLGK